MFTDFRSHAFFVFLYISGLLNCLKYLELLAFLVTKGSNLCKPEAFADPRKVIRCFDILILGAVLSFNETYILSGNKCQNKPVSSALYNWFWVSVSSVILSLNLLLNGSTSSAWDESFSPLTFKSRISYRPLKRCSQLFLMCTS